MKYKLTIDRVASLEVILETKPTLRDIKLFTLQGLKLVNSQGELKGLEEVLIVDGRSTLKTDNDLAKIFNPLPPKENPYLLYVELNYEISEMYCYSISFLRNLEIKITFIYEMEDFENTLYENLTATNKGLRKFAKEIHEGI